MEERVKGGGGDSRWGEDRGLAKEAGLGVHDPRFGLTSEGRRASNHRPRHPIAS